MDMFDATPLSQRFILARKAQLQRAHRRTGQIPNDRPTKNEVLSRFMHHPNPLARTLSLLKHLVNIPYLPPAHPPCFESLHNLSPITISNLRLEIHHRGRYLLLRPITHAVRLGFVTVVIEDLEGEVVLVQCCLGAEVEAFNDKTFFPFMVLAVKEPYYMDVGDSEYVIRVDHPSDLVGADKNDHRLPRVWRFRPRAPGTVETLWRASSEAFRTQRYWDTIKLYGSIAYIPKLKGSQANS